jgi:putative redox protein
MNARVNWHGNLTFTGSADTGFTVPLGAGPSVGGNNDGFRPLELMAVSLAGCTAMDVISILQKKRQQISDFRVEVNTDQSENHPKVFTQAEIEYHVFGNHVDQKAVARALELSATRYCPAQAMLDPVFPITLKYFIYDESGELLVSADYQPADQ